MKKHGTAKRIHSIRLALLAMAAFIALTVMPAESVPPEASATIESAYPGLASGVLTYARLGDLPGSTVLRSGRVEITADEVNGEILRAPEALRDELRKNGFFLLEQMATSKLLVQVAKGHSDKAGSYPSQNSEKEIIGNYLRRIVDEVEVTESDVKEFYQQNKDMFGGAKLDQVRKQLHQYMLHQKREQTISEHIRTLGQRIPIVVSASWIKGQAILARDNPVDKARSSGRPSLVDFGASGCRPCDMMAPILRDIKKKYEGELNVVFVHVREEQILAARYGIQGIPMQIFFDRDGKEVFRHTGFFSQKEIEKMLRELGVR